MATIDNNGLAQGLSPGTTTITAAQGGITNQLTNLSVTSGPVSRLTPLPPWLTYCDTEPCTLITPVVVYDCPAGSPQCTPARSTAIVPQVDDKPISGVIFPSILVYFTEAAGGASMIPVLESMKIPHAGSYGAAKQALGL